MTGVECLNKLPYKVQVQLLKNVAEQGNELYPYLVREWSDTAEFITGTFSWISSTEGHDYWSEMVKKYKTK